MRGLREAANRVGSLTNRVGRRRVGAVLGGTPTGAVTGAGASSRIAGLLGRRGAHYGAARDGAARDATQGAQGDARRTTAAHVEQTRRQGRCGLDGLVRRGARSQSGSRSQSGRVEAEIVHLEHRDVICPVRRPSGRCGPQAARERADE